MLFLILKFWVWNLNWPILANAINEHRNFRKIHNSMRMNYKMLSQLPFSVQWILLWFLLKAKTEKKQLWHISMSRFWIINNTRRKGIVVSEWEWLCMQSIFVHLLMSLYIHSEHISKSIIHTYIFIWNLNSQQKLIKYLLFSFYLQVTLYLSAIQSSTRKIIYIFYDPNYPLCIDYFIIIRSGVYRFKRNSCSFHMFCFWTFFLFFCLTGEQRFFLFVFCGLKYKEQRSKWVM